MEGELRLEAGSHRRLHSGKPVESDRTLQARSTMVCSKQKFHGELDLARSVCRTYRPKCRVRNPRVRDAEIRMVEHIEELGTELQSDRFADWESFIHSQIPLRESRSAE